MTHIYIDDCKVLAEGHANAKRNVHNHDLVCAAISALSCTLAEMVVRAAEKQAFEQEPKIELKPGWALIECVPKKEMYHDVKLYFDFFVCGVYQLQAEYKNNVKIIFQNGG